MSKSDDLISRQAAIDALGEEPIVWTRDDEYALGARTQWQIDKLVIETLPSAQPEQKMRKWISAKERTPDTPDNYLVTVVCKNALGDKTSFICMDYWTGWGWDDCGNGNDLEVIAWMFLPKAYQEEGGE